MKQAYLIKQGVEEFALAREQFAVIVAQLQSAVVLGREHGEVEKLVSREGTELLRRLVQAHRNLSMTLRHSSEEFSVAYAPSLAG